MSVLAPVRDYVHSLVHPSAQRDALTAARHCAFMVPRLLGGLAALAVLPVQLATRGIPGPVELVVFGWLILPTLAVYSLSRWGCLDDAYALSSLALTGLATGTAAATGGLASSAAMFLLAVPLEAALSTSRLSVLRACGMVTAAGCCVAAAEAFGFLPTSMMWQDPSVLGGLGVALAYAAALALAATVPAGLQTELLAAEAARYRLLAGNMTEVILRHGPNGAVVFVSPAAERVVGVPVNALRGHQLFDRVHVADRPAYLKALSDAAIEGGCRSVEFRIRHRTNEIAVPSHPRWIWLEMRSRPLGCAAGGMLGIDASQRELVSVLRDVTERKYQEQALEDARLHAEQAIAAKSRFLLTMSHELRTPLNAIIGFSDMLTNQHTFNIDGPRRHDYARLINDSGQHLLSVVNGILDMSRIEAGNFQIATEPFALGSVITGCCELLALKAHESGIELVFRHPPQLPELVADKRAIKQVLLNLLANALKFTRRGGQVIVSATLERSMVVMVIEDTGIGIPEAAIGHLGDPFFQVHGCYDGAVEGTGLGLSIVKSLVGLHGGTLEISSRLGHGTRVAVRLPVNRVASSPMPTQPTTDRSA